ncbi:MAG: ISNCY family transposase [Gammaproteobacteria bacterium]|nr:ISNCY family transposase [Gammaproteobacteria bacterium]MBU1653374.1 ISNCY family transposase [Gammaproteobacteria bacterium]MBU1960529.1 ISNCY family transposase [Gammaproteobacteria bacterium]
MRLVQNPQKSFGQVDISTIELDSRSRDDIPQLLQGLQHIYRTPALREAVFKILEEVRPRKDDGKEVSLDNGRPGMEQWKILVLGVLRLGLNADYDRIQELANQHRTIRQFLGHGDWYDEERYGLQRLRDNLRLFTPEILDRINQIVVQAGLALVTKGPVGAAALEPLHGRCDSFVVETCVHYPTDLNLLWDAVRKTLSLGYALAQSWEITGWRQYQHHQRAFKRQYRRLQKAKQRQTDQPTLEAEYLNYLMLALDHGDRAGQLLQQLRAKGVIAAETAEFESFAGYIGVLADQIDRRCLRGETIPHEEKIFSLFQPHTEWINKGKAGVPVELGVRVHIVEDQHRFILHHQVAQQRTDEKAAIAITRETKARYPSLRAMSFDKGYHSPDNQQTLPTLVEQVCLPKKGRLNAQEQVREQADSFKALRHCHSRVESAINALEHSGLDVCPDHGIDGFKRYVALAVVARNLKRLGALIQQTERKAAERKRGPYKKAA